jgi:heptosyltransferase I
MIGDVVFTTPIPSALTRTFPHSQISYLVEPAAAPVVAGNPQLAEIIIAPRRRGLRRIVDDIRLAGRLRAARFDLAIDLHGGPRSSWLTWATGARQRIGYDIEGRRWHYTKTVHRPRDLRPRHSVENQWDLLSAIDGWPGDSADPARNPVEMPLDAAAARRVDERLARAGVDARHTVAVVHVSAGNPFRRWPEPSFARLVAGLVTADVSRRIVLSSGPSDRTAADRIAAAARQILGRPLAAHVLDFGDIDLAELKALIERSGLFVGGDTGPLHIAATTRTPIVGIYGPTLAARSAPWRDPALATESVDAGSLPCRPCEQRVCAPGDFRCLTAIDPDRVLAAAERALGQIHA